MRCLIERLFLSLLEDIPPRRLPSKNLYLYGTSRVGKTMNSVNAIEDLGLSYYKKPPGDQWFDRYIDQKIIILEEFQSCFN